MINKDVKHTLRTWASKRRGVFASVDGQFGSTGKGVINGAMAEACGDLFNMAISNAGPNSGHTSYLNGEKIILKQLPTFAVIAQKLGHPILTNLTGGAVIDPEILIKEINLHRQKHVMIHQNAAVIDSYAKSADGKNVHNIASTGQGVGPAIIAKLERRQGHVYCQHPATSQKPFALTYRHFDQCIQDHRTFMEISQGFSLGINSGFYPHTTTRECTVSQGLADAGLPPNYIAGTIMSLRTFPIRVGDTANSSGPCYSDQKEISWEELNVGAETTTVTGRVRRIFTWSHEQYCRALVANNPDIIFVNFCNYVKDRGPLESFVDRQIVGTYKNVFKRPPYAVILGHGPTSDDLELWKRL